VALCSVFLFLHLWQVKIGLALDSDFDNCRLFGVEVPLFQAISAAQRLSPISGFTLRCPTNMTYLMLILTCICLCPSLVASAIWGLLMVQDLKKSIVSDTIFLWCIFQSQSESLGLPLVFFSLTYKMKHIYVWGTVWCLCTFVHCVMNKSGYLQCLTLYTFLWVEDILYPFF
jgi:hypothetical protein